MNVPTVNVNTDSLNVILPVSSYSEYFKKRNFFIHKMDFSTVYYNLLSEDDTKNPEQKIISFLNLVTEILDSNLDENKDTLVSTYCSDVVFIDTHFEQSWNKQELKEILFSDCEFTNRAEVFVKVILVHIRKQIDNFNVKTYQDTLKYSKKLNSFLKVCEKINISNLNNCVLQFLDQLFGILGQFTSNEFIRKGPLYQFSAKIIGSFKEIEYAQNCMLTNINNKLIQIFEMLENKQDTNASCSEICHFESLLLHLTILKDVVRYRLEQSFFKPDYTKKQGDVLEKIKQNFINLESKLPDYFKGIINECKNLL